MLGLTASILTPHAAALVVERPSVQNRPQSRVLQVLAPAAARGRHAALGRQRGVVLGRGGGPGTAQVLLGQPHVTQGLRVSAAHGRSQRDGALQGRVLRAAGGHWGQERTDRVRGSWR